MSENLPLAARKQGRREFLKAGGAITIHFAAPGVTANILKQSVSTKTESHQRFRILTRRSS